MTMYKKPVTLKEIIYSIINDRDRLDILNHIIKELTAVAGTDSVLDSLRAVLTEIRNDLDSAIQRSRAHPLTKPINTLHKERKETIARMFDGISFFVSSSNSEISTAAQEIKDSLQGHFTKLPDQKKRTLSAAVKSFLTDMKLPGVPEKLEKISFSEKVTELESCQTQFDSLIEERAKKEEKDESPTLIPAREQMSRFIDILEGHLYLNAYSDVAGTKELVHNLNGRIGEIMTTAKALHTMEENGHLKEKDKSDNSGEIEETPEEIDEVTIPEETTPDEENEQEGTGEEESEEKAFTRDDR